MDSPPHDNWTDFVVEPQVLVDRAGEVLVCIVKATFELPEDGAELELADEDEQRIVRPSDVPWGEPESSSILFPSDLCVRKPGTDVVLVAEACAPHDEPVPSFAAGIRLGPLQKFVQCFGLRVWEAFGQGISPALPTERVPLRYELAWGGVDDSDPTRLLEEPRNPVGTGVVRDPAMLTHRAAPQIEDAADPIVSCKTWPQPGGLGAIGRHWMPRRKFLGTYDRAWLDTRAPLPPLDERDHVNVCSSPGLWSEEPLRGGEEVALLNARPGGGATRFSLPSVGVQVEFRVEGRDPVVVQPHLDTVIVDALQLEPDEPLAVELVWRASIPAPRKLRQSRIIVRERG